MFSIIIKISDFSLDAENQHILDSQLDQKFAEFVFFTL